MGSAMLSFSTGTGGSEAFIPEVMTVVLGPLVGALWIAWRACERRL